MQRYLIAYDISKDKIRSRVFRRLKEKALPIQKSVFFFQGKLDDLNKLETMIQAMLEDSDSFLIIPCCDECFSKARIYKKLAEYSCAA